MPVESADDLAAFFSADDFASEATYRAAGAGAGVIVAGIFASGYLGQSLGGLAAEGREITFQCAAVDVAGVSQASTLEVGGIVYRVRSQRPDGTGVVVLVLGS